MSQQFCLKWNNHMNNMMDVFKNLLSTESMVDVTLACDGLSLKAHKMVLSACSPFFQSLFLENPCKHPIVILKDMKYTELKAIIEFMYHGEVNVAQEQLSALMKTAETLRVKGLAEMPNEKNSSSSAQEEPSHRSVPRTETPPPSKRRRGRVRKRSLSDSNRSDDSNDPKIKQPHSPDIEELSGDVTMDNTSGQFSNLQSQVPMQSLPSHSTPMNSYQKASVVSQDPQIEEPASADESEFGVEPAKLLEQTLTTDDLQNRRSSRSAMSSSMEMQRRPRSSTDHSSNLVPTSMSSDTSLSANQQPESPPDIKPELLELDPPMSPVAGPSHSTDNSMMMYMDQSSVSSHPGTSFQDNTALVPQDSQPQGEFGSEISCAIGSSCKKNPYVLITKLKLIDPKRNELIDKHVSKARDSSGHEQNKLINHQEIKKHVLVKRISKKYCKFCRFQGNVSRTKWHCNGCNRYFCNQKEGITCFDHVHSIPSTRLHSKLPASKSSKNQPQESSVKHHSKGNDQVHTIPSKGLSKPPASKSSKNQHQESSIEHYSKGNDQVHTIPSKGLSKPPASKSSKNQPKISAFEHSSDGNAFSREGHFLIPYYAPKACYRCGKRTPQKCGKCGLFFCNYGITGRECFNLHHARHIPWGEGHVLIKAYGSRKQCHLCRFFTGRKCKKCDLFFCNYRLSGRECFFSYHDDLQTLKNFGKNKGVVEKSEKISTDVEVNIGDMENVDSISNDVEGLYVPDNKGQTNPKTGHTPVSAKYKICFHCKAKKSNWCCKTCGKSLCIQKTGKTCFNMFHSKFKKGRRMINMKNVLRSFAENSG